ncbi:predicted protein [Sclerotinia sclerotiorum 1980 UF-70]|uniref:Uncharacterized protein n=1 Tax=Sclerotinia sclerotiorum (strain ATCC 18683 / 1980 / Ss-1) TaxID=665079 RepID=A7F4Z6_SCLS1|nr:predicted protein [Sclerotinia sclerotiorum 1980 UF-70]EDN97817.1 predicted protein [Sclerotinia sclerotiorum 1980 UF-70]
MAIAAQASKKQVKVYFVFNLYVVHGKYSCLISKKIALARLLETSVRFMHNCSSLIS